MRKNQITIVLDLSGNPYLIYINNIAYLGEEMYDLLEPTTNWDWKKTNEICNNFKGEVQKYKFSKRAFKKYNSNKTIIPMKFNRFLAKEVHCIQ